jgi:hypothetical protein
LIKAETAYRAPRACRLRVRLGRADYLPGSRMRGRCSPVSGPIRGAQIGAALGQFRTLPRKNNANGLRIAFSTASKSIVRLIKLAVPYLNLKFSRLRSATHQFHIAFDFGIKVRKRPFDTGLPRCC